MPDLVPESSARRRLVMPGSSLVPGSQELHPLLEMHTNQVSEVSWHSSDFISAFACLTVFSWGMTELSRPRTGEEKNRGFLPRKATLHEEWEGLCEWWGGGYCGVAHASPEGRKGSLYTLLTEKVRVCPFWTGDLSTCQVFNTSGFFFIAIPSSLEQLLVNLAGPGFPALHCIECPTFFSVNSCIQLILVSASAILGLLLHLAGHTI